MPTNERYFLLSDIHGNLDALDAVWKDIQRNKQFNPSKDVMVSLGDAVGYCAFPNQCVEWVENKCKVKIIGNHDIACEMCRSGRKGEVMAEMNPIAFRAIEWTSNELTAESLRAIFGWDKNIQIDLGDRMLLFGHESPRSSDSSEYVDDINSAEIYFFSRGTPKRARGFSGHSHRPQFYFKNKTGVEGRRIVPGKRLTVPFEEIINLNDKEQTLGIVPSIGQPRDGFWFSGYSIYDVRADSLTFRRLPYDVNGAGNAILSKNLPERLALRIKEGL